MTDQAQLSHDEQLYAIKTWRYLRLALFALVIGLAAAVAFEWRNVSGHCLQESISAYYYTPVRGFFVGALLSMGVCMFCLKGSTNIEDVLLNLAGMFAAVIALVPTPGIGKCSSLRDATTVRALSVANSVTEAADRSLSIENNVAALIAVGLVGLVILAALSRRNPPRGLPLLGYAAGAGLWVVAVVLFLSNRKLFDGHAHDIAAYLMFGCILGVVFFNAIGFSPSPRLRRNPYWLVFAAMVVSALGLIAAGIAGWNYWVIAIEGAFISLFAIFWLAQTYDLWHAGLR